ncbi:hypothetical protein BRC68_00310, partial [Halobacteriales archaeon QH_6_64_20]
TIFARSPLRESDYFAVIGGKKHRGVLAVNRLFESILTVPLIKQILNRILADYMIVGCVPGLSGDPLH